MTILPFTRAKQGLNAANEELAERTLESRMFTYAVGAFLLLAVVFGGSSQGTSNPITLVRLAAVGILMWSLLRLSPRGFSMRTWLALGLLAAVLAVPLLFLIPVPPAVWTSMPGRALAVTGLQAAGIVPAWAPLSLNPTATLDAFLALIPPAAMFLATLSLTTDERRMMVLWLCVLAAVTVFIGFAQLPRDVFPWKFYRYQSVEGALGFFPNRNHMATFALCLLPLVASVLLTDRGERRHIMRLFGVILFVLFVLGVGATRSRMGAVLLAPVVLGSLAIVWAQQGRSLSLKIGVIATGVIGFALFIQFALLALLRRFDNLGEDSRSEFMPIAAAAARHYQPLGSGPGTFEQTYLAHEPMWIIGLSHLNHAHNDFLEVWFETGWTGALLILAFVVLFAACAWKAWRVAGGPANHLARGATIMVGAVLAHSVVDYPLRTPTMAVIFGFAVALMLSAGSVEGAEVRPADDRRRTSNRPRHSRARS